MPALSCRCLSRLMILSFTCRAPDLLDGKGSSSLLFRDRNGTPSCAEANVRFAGWPHKNGLEVSSRVASMKARRGEPGILRVPLGEGAQEVDYNLNAEVEETLIVEEVSLAVVWDELKPGIEPLPDDAKLGAHWRARVEEKHSESLRAAVPNTAGQRQGVVVKIKKRGCQLKRFAILQQALVDPGFENARSHIVDRRHGSIPSLSFHLGFVDSRIVSGILTPIGQARVLSYHIRALGRYGHHGRVVDAASKAAHISLTGASTISGAPLLPGPYSGQLLQPLGNRCQ